MPKAAYLARKVTRSKWERVEGLAEEEIPSYGVTSDLRTGPANALSLWKCGDASEKAIQRVALALAASGEHLDTVELAWIRADELEADGISLHPTDGRTPIYSLVSEHVDTVALDLVRLGSVARRLHSALQSEQHRKLTRGEVTRLLVQATHDGTLDLTKVNPNLRTHIERKLNP
jgi:hypothetical protein